VSGMGWHMEEKKKKTEISWRWALAEKEGGKREKREESRRSFGKIEENESIFGYM